jgi:hypothetical protein
MIVSVFAVTLVLRDFGLLLGALSLFLQTNAKAP